MGNEDDDSQSSEDRTSYLTIISENNDSCNTFDIVPKDEELDMVNKISHLAIKKKGGRPRKAKKFSFFDIKLRTQPRKHGYAIKKTQSSQPRHQHKSSRIEATDILQLGVDLGLTPNFPENETLSVIKSRMTVNKV